MSGCVSGCACVCVCVWLLQTHEPLRRSCRSVPAADRASGGQEEGGAGGAGGSRVAAHWARPVGGGRCRPGALGPPACGAAAAAAGLECVSGAWPRGPGCTDLSGEGQEPCWPQSPSRVGRLGSRLVQDSLAGARAERPPSSGAAPGLGPTAGAPLPGDVCFWLECLTPPLIFFFPDLHSSKNSEPARFWKTFAQSTARLQRLGGGLCTRQAGVQEPAPQGCPLQVPLQPRGLCVLPAGARLRPWGGEAACLRLHGGVGRAVACLAGGAGCVHALGDLVVYCCLPPPPKKNRIKRRRSKGLLSPNPMMRPSPRVQRRHWKARFSKARAQAASSPGFSLRGSLWSAPVGRGPVRVGPWWPWWSPGVKGGRLRGARGRATRASAAAPGT